MLSQLPGYPALRPQFRIEEAPADKTQYVMVVRPRSFQHPDEFQGGLAIGRRDRRRLDPGLRPFPVVILIHGGCWSVKLRNLPERLTSFELLRPMAAALAKAGIASWNIEYRRLGNEGGGWPGTFVDLGKATDYVRVLAPRHRLDLNRAIAVGHSSGFGAREKSPYFARQK